MNKLSLLLLMFFSASVFSGEDRIYMNKNFNYQFKLPNNLCLVKSSDAQTYIFDRDTHKNKIHVDWNKPDLINGSNVYGEITVSKNIEFIDGSIDSYLENLVGQLDKWTIDYKYKTWTLIQSTKTNINEHDYIKEYHSLNLNKQGYEEYKAIKAFISDQFKIEPIVPDDIINIILIKGFNDGLQYDFQLSFRDGAVDETDIENIINSFELTPTQNTLSQPDSNINCGGF